MLESLPSVLFKDAAKYRRLFHMPYIEPLIFALVFAHSLSGTVMRNEIMYLACSVVFQYNASDCAQLSNNNDSPQVKAIESELQPYVANLFLMRTLLESIVPAVCGLFVGAWSDHYGRRPLMVLSMVGFSCTYVIAVVVCELAKSYVVNPWWYILTAVPHSLLGGNCVFGVAAFCFITDVTNTTDRPYRMILMEAFVFVGLMGGSLLSGYLYAATSASFIFSVSAICLCTATVYVVLYVPETLNYVRPNEEGVVECYKGQGPNPSKLETEKEKHTEREDSKETTQRDEKEHTSGPESDTEKSRQAQDPKRVTQEDSEKDTEGLQKAIPQEAEKEKENPPEAAERSHLFSWTLVKDMWLTCVKPRPHRDRSIIWLITGTMFISIFVMDGTMTIFYLFIREKFQWSVKDFSYFDTFSHVMPVVGTLLGFVILRKVFQMSVVSLALLGLVSEIFSCIAKGFASEAWHLYLSVVLGIFRTIAGPMCHTIISNIVPSTDMGKIFSIKNIFSSFAPFIAAPLYTLVYKLTLSTFPGLFNLINAALYLVAVAFIFIVLRFKYNNPTRYGELLK